MAVVTGVWIGGLTRSESHGSFAFSPTVQELLHNRFTTTAGSPTINGHKHLCTSGALLRFYERRAYRPAWSDEGGLLPYVDSLLSAIRAADREGLRPADYHLAAIERTFAEIRQRPGTTPSLPPHQLADLDVRLTDAFLSYGSHLLAGRINPTRLATDWLANPRKTDLVTVLEGALETQQIEQTLVSLLPPHASYDRLRQALAHYRDIVSKGGWPRVPDGPKMQKGDRSERVAALRTRLLATQDLEQDAFSQRDVFDEALAEGVQRFQQRHGLDVDGVVGRATLAALNISAQERVRQMQSNLERWRWLPEDLGPRHLLVNIPNFTLDVIEAGQPVMTKRVVVGTPRQRTPVLSSTLTAMVLNPSWHVPRGIALRELLPTIRRNTAYLKTHRMTIVSGQGGAARVIDPYSINWATVSAKNFPYRFRQQPGPKNALGQVKFLFPNSFNVYLHDTQSRNLFAKTARHFSHGCIRVEQPLELADLLLQRDPTKTSETVHTMLETRAERTIRIPQPVPVHLVYWTAWVEEDGRIQFRNDIYGHDVALGRALGES